MRSISNLHNLANLPILWQRLELLEGRIERCRFYTTTIAFETNNRGNRHGKLCMHSSCHEVISPLLVQVLLHCQDRYKVNYCRIEDWLSQ